MIEEAENFAKYFPVQCSLEKIRDVKPHFHCGQIELLYCLSGVIEISAGNYHGKIYAGELFLINREEIFFASGDGRNELLRVHIDWPQDLFLFRKYQPDSDAACIEELKAHLLTCACMTFMEQLVEDEEYMDICSKIIQLVKRAFSVELNGKYHAILYRIFSESEKKFAMNLSIPLFARECEIKPQNLMNAFAQTGIGNYTSFIMQLRCRKAEMLLFETGHSIGKIANACGFSSDKVFIKNFKKYSGMTPYQRRLQYKKMSKNRSNKNILLHGPYAVETTIKYLGLKYIDKIRKQAAQ